MPSSNVVPAEVTGARVLGLEFDASTSFPFEPWAMPLFDRVVGVFGGVDTGSADGAIASTRCLCLCCC